MGRLSCDACDDYADVDDDKTVASAQITVFVAAHPRCESLRLKLAVMKSD